jgi:diguanylate cyclase (GGDEF)-like protein/PAS domain S-box-containing protein
MKMRFTLRWPQQIWRWYLGFGLLMMTAYFLSLPVPQLRVSFYTTIGASALIAIGWHVFRNLRQQPWTWSLLGLGLLLYFLGDFTYTYYRFFLHTPPPFPGIADAFFLASRIPLFAGLIQLTRTSTQRQKPFTLLDMFILGAGLSLIWWTVLMAPLAYNPSYTPIGRLIAVAYPALDFLLLGGGIRLALTTTNRSTSHYLVGGALAGLLVSDIIYTILQLLGSYSVGSLLDVGWIAFYVLLGASALYPHQPPSEPLPVEVSKHKRESLKLFMLVMAALLLPITLTLSLLLRHGWQDPVLIALGTLLIILAILRLYRLMQANIALEVELAKLKSDVLFRSIVERAYSGVSKFQADLTPDYHSPNMYKLAALDDNSSTDFRELINPEDRAQFQDFWHSTIDPTGDAPTIEYRLRAPDGSWRDVESTSNNLLDDEWIHDIVLITRDITARKQYERKLQHMAYTDSLTGLPNRAALQEQLEHAISNAAEHNRLAAAFFFDLDSFSAINDSLGHTFGDQVLIELGQRFTASLDAGSTVARFGGDEFMVVNPNLHDVANAKLVYQRLCSQLERPFEIGSYHIHLTACAGIAICDGQTLAPDEVIRNADLALRSAKQSGPGTMRIFNEQLFTTSVRRLELTTSLRSALTTDPADERAPGVLYQPIINLRSGEIIGAEALMVWYHPLLGYIDQDELMSLASDSDLYDLLQSNQCQLACASLTNLNDYIQGKPFRISLNIAGATLSRQGFDAVMLETLRIRRIPTNRIALEIPEEALVKPDYNTSTGLMNLADSGVAIVIDNFGREYSSLSELYRLPSADLKIDQSIIASLDESDTLPMLKSVIDLAHALGRSIIAQGVNSSEQDVELRALDCDFAQGAFYSRPGSFEHLKAHLAQPQRL